MASLTADEGKGFSSRSLENELKGREARENRSQLWR